MHIYELDGGQYPSVTTILHIVSKDDALMHWANHMGFMHKDIDKIKETTAKFGTLAHSHLQQEVDPNFNDAIPFKNNLEKYEIEKVLDNFREFFKDIKYETVATEKTIISKKLGYAGTLDWLANIYDNLFLNDFKTAKTPHDNMFLQLGGYYNLLIEETNYKPSYGSIIIANTQRCKMYPITRAMLEHYGKIFNYLVPFYNKFMNEMIIEPQFDILDSIKTDK